MLNAASHLVVDDVLEAIVHQAAVAALVVGLRHPGRHEGPLEGSDGSIPGSDPTP